MSGPMQRMFGDASLKREFGVIVLFFWLVMFFWSPEFAADITPYVLSFCAAVVGLGQWTRHKEKLHAGD